MQLIWLRVMNQPPITSRHPAIWCIHPPVPPHGRSRKLVFTHKLQTKNTPKCYCDGQEVKHDAKSTQLIVFSVFTAHQEWFSAPSQAAVWPKRAMCPSVREHSSKHHHKPVNSISSSVHTLAFSQSWFTLYHQAGGATSEWSPAQMIRILSHTERLHFSARFSDLGLISLTWFWCVLFDSVFLFMFLVFWFKLGFILDLPFCL